MDTDSLEPPRLVLRPLDLGAQSVDELKAYIERLRAEISQAEAMIAKKQQHASAAAHLFKTKPLQD